MDDTDVWDSGAISTPAANDRVPIASGSLAGGYSLRGEFVWRDAAGLFQLAGIAGATAAHNIVPAASNLFGGLQVYNGGLHDMSLLAKGSTGEVNLSCGRSVGWGGHFKIIIDTVERVRVDNSGTLAPSADNSQTLGSSSKRWSVVYAGTGTINTSDAREKTERRGFTLAELSAARRIAATIGVFQFVGRIREHVGVVAQDVWAIMADEGLIEPIVEGVSPSSSYAFLCYDEWSAVEAADAVLDEDGEVIAAAVEAREAGNRFGIRPDQLAYFLIAAQEARIAALESA